jgi:hypothetical protein
LIAALPVLAWTSAGAETTARIAAPASGASVTGRIEIIGRATTDDPADFDFYRLYYGVGALATSLRPLGPAVDRPVTDGTLGSWDTSILSAGQYLILLNVYDKKGQATSDQVIINVVAAPTPTPLARPGPIVVVPTVEGAPAGGEEPGQPGIELPELQPNIPILEPLPAPSGPAPIIVAPAPAPLPAPVIIPSEPLRDPIEPLPLAPIPLATPAFDTLPPAIRPLDPAPIAPIQPIAPINQPIAPPAPIIQPFEPPPPLPTLPLPTPFGIPQ